MSLCRFSCTNNWPSVSQTCFYLLICLFTASVLTFIPFSTRNCYADNTDKPVIYIVQSGDTLFEIARRSHVSTDSLRRLNNISGDRIYPGQKLRLRPSLSTDGKTCIVIKGDTLSDISRQYGLTIETLKDLNELKNDVIYPGMKLIVVEDTEEDEEDQFEYVVKKGDNLYSISRKFNVGVDFLRQLNNIKGKNIYPGQRLQLKPTSLDEATYVVRKGDTLSEIARKYRINISTLKTLNGIRGNKIFIGQKLRIKASQTGIHMVERGDALWEIAQAYGMTVDEIKELNELTSDRIYPGQELKLSVEKSEIYDRYKVKPGDYLNSIARLHQMDLDKLMEINNLKKSIIHPGDILKVKPILRKGKEWIKMSEINWETLINPRHNIKSIPSGNGPYYHTQPMAYSQKNSKYFEGPRLTPLTAYKRGTALLNALDHELERVGRLSKDLKGWHFVLDPGHGGLDPGAIKKADDGSGKSVYVVEDEYSYDMALRVYVLLRLHSADVTMTILSPNHLIRGSSPPSKTFVNEKNEVYNSYAHNKSNNQKDWPNGGKNFYTRVNIAKTAFKGVPKNRRIFLSFHADNTPNIPEAPLVLYWSSRGSTDNASRDFAKAILPALGAGAYTRGHTRGQNLGVLRNNPASIKVLFELRNLAYSDHAWALRYEELRHRDAEKVVKGILEYVKSKS